MYLKTTFFVKLRLCPKILKFHEKEINLEQRYNFFLYSHITLQDFVILFKNIYRVGKASFYLLHTFRRKQYIHFLYE